MPVAAILAAISIEGWVGLVAIPIGLAIVTLLITLTSQQSGTNVRLDGIKQSLDSHGNKLDNHEERLDQVEQKQIRHDIFWQSFRVPDQTCPSTRDNRS